MKSLDWYKEKYPDNNQLYVENGKAFIPIYLLYYILDKSGLKSRKKRILKKVITREFNKILKDSL